MVMGKFCAVFGDYQLDDLTADDIMEYCHEKLASFKRPRSVVFVDELPRNQLGKVLHKTLREQYGKQ